MQDYQQENIELQNVQNLYNSNENALFGNIQNDWSDNNNDNLQLPDLDFQRVSSFQLQEEIVDTNNLQQNQQFQVLNVKTENENNNSNNGNNFYFGHDSQDSYQVQQEFFDLQQQQFQQQLNNQMQEYQYQQQQNQNNEMMNNNNNEDIFFPVKQQEQEQFQIQQVKLEEKQQQQQQQQVKKQSSRHHQNRRERKSHDLFTKQFQTHKSKSSVPNKYQYKNVKTAPSVEQIIEEAQETFSTIQFTTTTHQMTSTHMNSENQQNQQQQQQFQQIQQQQENSPQNNSFSHNNFTSLMNDHSDYQQGSHESYSNIDELSMMNNGNNKFGDYSSDEIEQSVQMVPKIQHKKISKNKLIKETNSFIQPYELQQIKIESEEISQIQQQQQQFQSVGGKKSFLKNLKIKLPESNKEKFTRQHPNVPYQNKKSACEEKREFKFDTKNVIKGLLVKFQPNLHYNIDVKAEQLRNQQQQGLPVCMSQEYIKFIQQIYKGINAFTMQALFQEYEYYSQEDFQQIICEKRQIEAKKMSLKKKEERGDKQRKLEQIQSIAESYTTNCNFSLEQLAMNYNNCVNVLNQEIQVINMFTSLNRAALYRYIHMSYVCETYMTSKIKIQDSQTYYAQLLVHQKLRNTGALSCVK